MMGKDYGKDADRCDTCGRPRGLQQQRRSWGIHPTVGVPRTGDRNDHPRQINNDMICSASVYRNGGTDEFSHLCDECLRIGLRAIKVRVCELLQELDTDHDKERELADVTARLHLLQARHHNVCFDHDRMQVRMAQLLTLLGDDADVDIVRSATFEVQRKAALS